MRLELKNVSLDGPDPVTPGRGIASPAKKNGAG
jgi:hypothetical protein